MQLFPHQCPFPKTFSVNAAIVAARALTEALTKPVPAALFAQFGNAQQQTIVDLAKIFESAIAKPAIPSLVPPQPSVQKITPPSLLVTIPPAYPRVKISPSAPKVKIPPAASPPSPPTVFLPYHLHVIDPDCNGDNIDAVTVTRYRLRLHPHQRPFAAQEPHYISANTSAMAQPPRFSPGTGSRYARSARHLIATEHRRTNHANTVIDTDTGQTLEYSHLTRGPDKDIWKTSLANKLGRLAQGVGTIMPTGTNTVFFIPRSAIPAGRTVTYSQLVASIQPNK